MHPFLDNSSIVSESVEYKDQEYKVGDIVVLEAKSQDELKVGLIQSIVVKEEILYYVIYKYSAHRIKSLQYFQSGESDGNLYFIQASNVIDYKPLIMHGTLRKFKFNVHHHISVKM